MNKNETINGLSSTEVKQRINEGKVNKTIDDQARSIGQIVKDNVFNYFNLIFLVLAVLLILVGDFKELTFMPIVIANVFIGIFQEIRAKRVLDNLNILNTLEIDTIRNGKNTQIPIDELVLNDVICLKTGDQIPADGEIISGSIRVNESLLTGESDEVIKETGKKVLSGSFVVSGQAFIVLQKVGKEAYASKIMLSARKLKTGEQSEMVKSVNKLIKWIGIIIIPFGIALFSVAFFVNSETIADSVISMEAAIVGMIPEGLYLLMTISLALSATRLAENKVMLHDMKSIETLARVNILCVDKTGTITEPKMTVQNLIAISESDDYLNSYLASLVKAMPADNATINALSEKFTNYDKDLFKVKQTIPFTSVNKYSGVVIDDSTYLMGAPEFVLCNQFSDYKKEIDQYTLEGYRVLAFIKYPKILKDENEKLTENVNLIGLILIANPIRKEAKKTFKYFEKQDVLVKVISGDNVDTVSRVAHEAGIKNADMAVDATLLNDDNYDEAVKKYNVFGRVKPEQKQKLIKALQKQNNTVAMTGDGVNDILAMKIADCSIAMASGNNAAVQASQVVLLDSDFSKMPEVVNEGRKVVNNIERSASLFLVKNIFSILMTIFTLVFALTYPLKPSQIALISALTIGLPSFLLALENNYSRIKGMFIPDIMSRAIPGGVTDMLAVAILVGVNSFLNLSHAEVATTATMLLIAVGLMVLYNISAPLNKFRAYILGFTGLSLSLSIIFAHNLFSLSRISFTTVVLMLILFFVEYFIFKFLTSFADQIKMALVFLNEYNNKIKFRDIINYFTEKNK